MTSKKGNRDFLLRINEILGERAKHPWGDALGLKNTRIQSIFQGQVPTSDALEIIHRAEKVRVDWLLTGEGPPFLVINWLSDVEVVEKLRGSLAGEVSAVCYLLTDGGGRATLVTTQPTVRENECGAVSRFTEVNVYPDIGQAVIEALIAHANVRVVSLAEEIFEEISTGWKGPVHLLGGLLEHYASADGEKTASQIKSAMGRFELQPQDEVALIDRYRHLQRQEREAVLTVLGAMGTSRSFDVMQRPSRRTVKPATGSDAKGNALGAGGQLSPADKVHSDD